MLTLWVSYLSEVHFRDRITNNLLLLYTIARTNELGTMDDTLKLQKIVFHSQRNLVKMGLKAFGYNFFRWEKGPFSAELNNDLTLLTHAGLIEPAWPLKLTESGNKLLETSQEIFEINKRFMRYIEDVVREKAPLDPDTIREETYKLTIILPRSHERMTIRDVPMGTLILFRTSDRKAKAIFSLPESWLATLEIAFNEEVRESLAKSYEDAVEGRGHEFRLCPQNTIG